MNDSQRHNKACLSHGSVATRRKRNCVRAYARGPKKTGFSAFVNLPSPKLSKLLLVQFAAAPARAATRDGKWTIVRSHCRGHGRTTYKKILRLRSLITRGRAREGLAAPPAIKFILRRADNGVLWNILSFWRATE